MAILEDYIPKKGDIVTVVANTPTNFERNYMVIIWPFKNNAAGVCHNRSLHTLGLNLRGDLTISDFGLRESTIVKTKFEDYVDFSEKLRENGFTYIKGKNRIMYDKSKRYNDYFDLRIINISAFEVIPI